MADLRTQAIMAHEELLNIRNLCEIGLMAAQALDDECEKDAFYELLSVIGAKARQAAESLLPGGQLRRDPSPPAGATTA